MQLRKALFCWIPWQLKRKLRRFWRQVTALLIADPSNVPPRELQRLSHLPPLTHTFTPLLGRRIEITDPVGYLLCYRELFQEQIYWFEADVDNPIILDCGANIGVSIVYFKHLYPAARITAFEPDPNIFRILQNNVTTYGFHDVVLIPKAVWSSDTTLPFRPDGSVAGRLVPGEQGSMFISVPATRLRDFLQAEIALLKLDVEGAEYEVLCDCQYHLQRVQHMFIEYHGKADTPQRLHDILSILQQAGFRYHIKEANPIAHPFLRRERNRLYDLQLNIFAFRV